MAIALGVIQTLFTLSRFVGAVLHYHYALNVYIKIYAYSIAIFCFVFTIICWVVGFKLNKMVKKNMMDSKESEKSRQRLLVFVGGSLPFLLNSFLYFHDFSTESY